MSLLSSILEYSIQTFHLGLCAASAVEYTKEQEGRHRDLSFPVLEHIVGQQFSQPRIVLVNLRPGFSCQSLPQIVKRGSVVDTKVVIILCHASFLEKLLPSCQSGCVAHPPLKNIDIDPLEWETRHEVLVWVITDLLPLGQIHLSVFNLTSTTACTHFLNLNL